MHCDNEKVVALFEFYNEEIKPLYCAVQASGELTLETLHELNAALDHVSRLFLLDLSVEGFDLQIEKAKSHFKRACLDIYKLKLVDIVNQHSSLEDDYEAISLIDNGNFPKKMNQAFIAIRKKAAKAREYESSLNLDEDVLCDKEYECWAEVYKSCCIFESKYYNHKDRLWGRNTLKRRRWKDRILSGLVGFAFRELGHLLPYFYVSH